MKKQYDYLYDVALSFGGADRGYVEKIANVLHARGVKVFYDHFSQIELWGKDLYQHLTRVYRDEAFCSVLFISKDYAAKRWASHELKAQQARAFEEGREYILPARFDDTELPGLNATIGYLDLRSITVNQLADAICEKIIKLGGRVPRRIAPVISAMPRAEPLTSRVHLLNAAGSPIFSASVAAIAPNGTRNLASPDAAGGDYRLSLPYRSKMTLFCAHPSYPAFLLEGYDPVYDLEITLYPEPGVGSMLIDGVAYIPGLEGRLNPISNSTTTSSGGYVYADNISVSGKDRPAKFQDEEVLEMEDARGTVYHVEFRRSINGFSIVEYRFVQDTNTTT